MNRPRLTDKVMRGLDLIEAHASADLETIRGDDRPQEPLRDMEAGLTYLCELRAWYRAQQK